MVYPQSRQKGTAVYKEYRREFSSKNIFPKDNPKLRELYNRYDICSKLSHPSLYSFTRQIDSKTSDRDIRIEFKCFQLSVEDMSEPARTFLWIVSTHFLILRVFEEILDEAINQLDIIIYDSINYPTIFKDKSFVVVRPEAVRSIIEVKGSLDNTQIDSFMALFIDFGRKWSKCDLFYRDIGLEPLRNPGLFVMCWSVPADSQGRPKSDGARLRKRIVLNFLC